MQRFLPSKKFILIALGILIGIGLFFLGRFLLHKNETTADTLTVEKVAVKTIIENDTDGDGVRDWEETLWGTDPTKETTYGSPDAEYIQQKKENIAAGNTTSSSNTAEEKSIDTFAKEFLATVVSLSSSGTLTKENLDILAKKYSTEIGKRKLDIVKPYAAADVKTGGTLKSYQTALTKTLSPYVTAKLGSELDIIQKSFSEDGSLTNTEAVRSAGATYTKLSTDLMNLAVPETMKELHVEFANQSALLGSIIISLSETTTDPFGSMIAFSNYSSTSDAFLASLGAIIDRLQQNGIIQ